MFELNTALLIIIIDKPFFVNHDLDHDLALFQITIMIMSKIKI